MVGYGNLGGTCVNVGCVPSKYLIDAAAEIYAPGHPRYPGITPFKRQFSFEALMNSLREAVKGERSTKYEEVIRNYDNVELVRGVAAFAGNDRVVVHSSAGARVQELKGYNFIIATGSSANIPNVTGLKEAGYLTSDTVWGIEELPQRLVVIGGGAVAVELGQAFSRLGSEVVILQRHASLLPRAEPELAGGVIKALESEGLRVELNATVTSVEKTSSGKRVKFLGSLGSKEVEADEILVATGRSPNVSELNLGSAGVVYSPRGVRVEPTMMTTNHGIYAAGDVVDQKFMLETLAAKEGTVAADNIYDHAMKKVDLNEVPWSVFSDPQLASVGYKESEYPAKSISRSLPLELVPRARITRKTDGMFKLVTDSETGKIVGVHALAPNATELIIEGVYAIRYGLTVNDLIESSHIFPTISEGVKLTGQSFVRDIRKMSCCME